MDELIEDNLACLDQGINLLGRISGEVYGKSCPSCFESSIGGHLRHNADHYEQFLCGYESGRVDYDARSRHPEVEKRPEVALELLRSLRAALAVVPNDELEKAVLVRMDAGDSSQWTASSVRRELQFLISHSIHHYALIAVIAGVHGVRDMPPGFGMAPSTLKFRASKV